MKATRPSGQKAPHQAVDQAKPGAPDGEYVVLQYHASCEHKAAAVETVTATREPDGAWRVVGYFVR